VEENPRMSEALQLPDVPSVDVSRIKLSVLSADVAINGWEIISPHLGKVFEHSAGRLDMDDTFEVVKSGMAEVLLVWEPDISRVYAVIVAEARHYPQRKVYSLGLCGGENLPVWAEHIWPALQHVAREKGYDQIEIVGRRGWGRFIPGSKEIATFYAMDLDGGPVETEEVQT
jgi:hypothetical protein